MILSILRTYTALMESLRDSRRPQKSTCLFPIWDGKRATVASWRAKVGIYKSDPYYEPVTDWNVVTAATSRHSTQVKTDIFARCKDAQLNQFIENTAYGDNGFAMLAKLLFDVDPKTPANMLTTVRSIGSFGQEAGEELSAYMQRARTLEGQLSTITVAELVPTLVIAGMDGDIFSRARTSW